jgi:hypothetical protein
MLFMCCIVGSSYHDPHFILNKDQMPVCFAMSTMQMLELISKKESTSTRPWMTQSVQLLQ